MITPRLMAIRIVCRMWLDNMVKDDITPESESEYALNALIKIASETDSPQDAEKIIGAILDKLDKQGAGDVLRGHLNTYEALFAPDDGGTTDDPDAA
jgi:hypothetical protein